MDKILYYWTATFIFTAATAVTNANQLVVKSNQLGGRIVGGIDASIINFPYQLSLQYNREHYCGAVLISSSWILSAAHCTDGKAASMLSLQAGTTNRLHGGQLRTVSYILVHPNYEDSIANYDITLLRSGRPFILGFNVRPISLPSLGETWTDGTYSVVSGWGILQENSPFSSVQLQWVILPLVNQAKCNVTYRGRITDAMICAGYWEGGKDACHMDSGGPLVIRGKLAGIVSWGNQCALAGFPGVYTCVAFFRSWITAVTGL